ncbi:hypothetical protein [Roseimarinus sediminis]|uniref:hypothetical protein n=1 Tax=Roseimarinus sediminis TaxID=1610899 RepID=UPI003D1F5A1A
MFKLKLKRKIIKARKAKKKAIVTNDFESAAMYRDEEKKLFAKIQKSKASSGQRSVSFLKLYSFYSYGLIVQRTNSKIPDRIEYYPFATWMNILFKAGIKSYSNINAQWSRSEQSKNQLFEQATDYYILGLVLKFLSTQNGWYTLDRSMILGLLPHNCFLNEFTARPSSNLFFPANDNPDASIHYAMDKENQIIGFFECFDYNFPYQCKAYFQKGNYIFNTPFFSLKFKAKYIEKPAYMLPADYAKYYLGFERNSDGRKLQLSFVAQLKLKIFFPWNWHYFRTLRLLKLQIIETFSADHYFQQFNWQTIRMQSKIVENILVKLSKEKPDQNT